MMTATPGWTAAARLEQQTAKLGYLGYEANVDDHWSG
jgi:hypothetical protein